MDIFKRSVAGAAMIAARCYPAAEPTTFDLPPKKTEFAEDAVQKVIAPVDLKFDQERSLKYLKQLCDIGPRISGSEGMKKQQDLIEKHFKDLGATVTRQEFKAHQQSRKDPT